MSLNTRMIFTTIVATAVIAWAGALCDAQTAASTPGNNYNNETAASGKSQQALLSALLDKDPFGLYGPCVVGKSGARSKLSLVSELNKRMDSVIAIDVLECAFYNGGGGVRIVDCPASTKYSYCLQNDNDGVGNHVVLGVLESPTDPDGLYGLPGNVFRKKSDVVSGAGKNPSLAKKIFIDAIGYPWASGGPQVVACSPNNKIYTYCVAELNDGVYYIALGVVE